MFVALFIQLNIMKKIPLFLLLLFAIGSCKKAKLDANDIGGDTNIALTEVGRQSSVYLNMGGSYVSGSMVVTSNNGGIVNYHLVANLTGNPDSAMITGLVPAEFKNPQGEIEADFKFNITSEGIVDFFIDQKPRLLVKYDDNVGAAYSFTATDGNNFVRTITEKTGIDEWPLGWMLIKTVKVEEDLPANDYNVTSVTYRANHKFGLVYIEAATSLGATISMDIYPHGL